MSSDTMNTTPPSLEDQGYTAKLKMSTKFSTKKTLWKYTPSYYVFRKTSLMPLINTTSVLKHNFTSCFHQAPLGDPDPQRGRSSGGPYHHNMLLQKDRQEERGRQQGNVSLVAVANRS